MGRALKYLLRLAVFAVVALVVYALVADLPPPTRTVEVDLAVPAAPKGGPVDAPDTASEDADSESRAEEESE